MGSIDLKFVKDAVTRIGDQPEAVIPLLQELQDHYGYLPTDALQELCASTRITPAAVTEVATFYDMFRHEPAGQHILQVCHGTACHVGGAERVEESLRTHLGIPAGSSTNSERQFTVERVACLGCCTLAPVVKIEDTIGQVTAEKAADFIREFLANRDRSRRPRIRRPALPAVSGQAQVQVCLDSCCVAKGTDRVFEELENLAGEGGARVAVKRVGCVGACYRTPMIQAVMADAATLTRTGFTPAQARTFVERHFPGGGWVRRLSDFTEGFLDRLLFEEEPGAEQATDSGTETEDSGARAFFKRQVHIATEHFGTLDPLDLDEYLAHEGFAALRRCLQGGAPEVIIDVIDRSGLRGRGGAGFPTGKKWRLVRDQPAAGKVVICNGDEGDPGAFMDRVMLESFPFRVIEGLAIAAVAVGAHEGIFYIRHEYPNALRRVRAALKEFTRRGWLGERLLGTDYALRLSIKEGAGAFVCGEETALIASIEGRSGMPRLRPPYPAQAGLWGRPTLINNVETLATVPWIVRHGAETFAAMGTTSSKGTKVFALAGKVRRAGLIEIPMGTTLREIVEDIGGGVPEGRRFKAVQIGGPSGGCVPARLADTPVDYQSLGEIGAIMGSGGLVVLDDTACMVDIARYFLQFTQNQSCGKCIFCRIGTKRMLEILELTCAGRAQKRHLDQLEDLVREVGQGSLCGLGKTAPNPVATTLRYFRHEYEAHLQGRCSAGKCKALIRYVVNGECTGCTLCAQKCPVNAIPMTPYAKHCIDLDLCTRCDTCRQVCPHEAIEVN